MLPQSTEAHAVWQVDSGSTFSSNCMQGGTCCGVREHLSGCKARWHAPQQRKACITTGQQLARQSFSSWTHGLQGFCQATAIRLGSAPAYYPDSSVVRNWVARFGCTAKGGKWANAHEWKSESGKQHAGSNDTDGILYQQLCHARGTHVCFR